MKTSRVSTGRRGYSTPAGLFNIVQKRKWHRSNIYSQAPMPYMQRLTWSGIALHAGYVPSHPASHGCIRLPNSFAKEMFGKTRIGTHVVVTHGDAKPVAIEHPALIQPKPQPALAEAKAGGGGHEVSGPAAGPTAQPGLALAPSPASLKPVSVSTEDGPAAAQPAETSAEPRSTAPLRVLLTRRNGRERMMDVQRLLAELGHDPGEIDGYMGSETGAAIKAFQGAAGLPVTGAYSDDLLEPLHRAANKGPVVHGHLYVRQDFKEVFDAPVVLREPEKPLGHHLYAVSDFDGDATSAQWFAVTADAKPETTAQDALGRFEIPEEIRQRLSEMLTPGSSMLVSDEGIGPETGEGTDFTVLVR